jgi:hypothetical protein
MPFIDHLPSFFAALALKKSNRQAAKNAKLESGGWMKIPSSHCISIRVNPRSSAVHFLFQSFAFSFATLAAWR